MAAGAKADIVNKEDHAALTVGSIIHNVEARAVEHAGGSPFDSSEWQLTLRALQEKGVDINASTCLHMCVGSYNTALVAAKLLLACCADPVVCDTRGYTLLHAVAAGAGHTLLHAAARHNRADCIPLLIAKGVDVLALNAQGASALQLACLHSDTGTVQLLLGNGTWLDDLASACMLNATIAGKVDTMTVLCARDVSYSTAIDDAAASTLMHAAAAYGRLECVSLVLQHGCDANALSSDGVSALDMALATELPASLKLLQQSYCCTMVQNAAPVLLECIGQLRGQNAQQHEVLSTHAKGLCSAAKETGMQPSSADAVCTAVRVQSVDSTTGAKSKRVYTLDTALLSKLHAVTAPGSAGVLLSMLAPLDGMLSVDGHAAANDIKLLSCNGKLARKVGCAAIEFALGHHQRQFKAGGSELLHTGCADILRVLCWLRDEVPGCQCWGDEQTTLSNCIKYNCVKGARHLVSTGGAVRLDSLLHEACAQQYGGEMVLELVRLGADIYSKVRVDDDSDDAGVISECCNVLQIAVTADNTEIVRALLHIEKTKTDEGELPLLMQAFADGSSVLHAAVTGSSGTHEGVGNSVLKALIQHKDEHLTAALQMIDSVGRTAVHCAIEQHKYELAELLLQACSVLGVIEEVLAKEDESGASVLCLSRRIATTSSDSVMSPYTEEDHEALHHAEVDCETVHEAVRSGHVGCLTLLLSSDDYSSAEALFDAAQHAPLHYLQHNLDGSCYIITALLSSSTLAVKTAVTADDHSALVNTVQATTNTQAAVVCQSCLKAVLDTYATFNLDEQQHAAVVQRCTRLLGPLLLTVELCNDADVAECIQTVKALQQAGVNVARREGASRRVEVLLACGADPTARIEEGLTVMHAAAAWSSACCLDTDASNAAVIQMLYGCGGKVLLNAKTPTGQTALHLAVPWPSNVERLLQLGAAVNALDNGGRSALYTACAAPAITSAPDSVRLLLAAGVTADLHCAQQADYTEGGGWQAVHAAVMQYDTDASTEGALDVLLESGVSVDATTTEGCTAAWLVARYGTAAGLASSLLDTLLRAGADLYHHTPQHGLTVNSDDETLRNAAGKTPLHCAVGGGFVEAVKLLIKEGCDVTATDVRGNTALRTCLLAGHYCKELFKVVLAANSDNDVDDDVLPDTGAITFVLSADATSVARQLAHVIILSALIDDDNYHDANTLAYCDALTTIMCFRCTLLHTAAAQNRSECIPLLMEKGVDVTALDDSCKSALQLACQYTDKDTVQLLLDHGAWDDDLYIECVLAAVAADNAAVLHLLNQHCEGEVDEVFVSATDECLLHAAAAWGKPRCVALLLFEEAYDYGGEEVNAEGRNALDFACAAELPESLRSFNIPRADWSLAGNERYAEVTAEHMVNLKFKLYARDDVLAAHADNNTVAAAVAAPAAAIATAPAAAAAVATAALVSSNAVKKFQLVNADTGAKGKRVYTNDSALLAKLHTVHAYGEFALDVNFTAALQNADVTPVSYKESDFTEQGFDCVMEYLYTAKVDNVTYGFIDKDKFRAALQCADFLGVVGLDESANEWAEQCDFDIENYHSPKSTYLSDSHAHFCSTPVYGQSVFGSTESYGITCGGRRHVVLYMLSIVKQCSSGCLSITDSRLCDRAAAIVFNTCSYNRAEHFLRLKQRRALQRQSLAWCSQRSLLRRFLSSPDGLSEGSVSAVLDRVSAHAKAPSVQSRDCTGCVKALLQVEATPAAKTKRYAQAVTPLSLSAAAGRKSCVEALLDYHLQHDNKLSFTQWHDAVLRAVGCVQLGVVQTLFAAISDEALKRRVRCAALEFALDHHQRQFIADGSERLHSSCAGMMQVFRWLRDEVSDCQCWGTEQAALSSFINYNCAEGVRRIAETGVCDVDLDSLLHEACAQPYDSDVVMELVRLGADIYSEVAGSIDSDSDSNCNADVTKKPCNVLQTALRSGNTDIFDSTTEG
eukprot:13788-Heterococcus_DN1.PRE.2